MFPLGNNTFNLIFWLLLIIILLAVASFFNEQRKNAHLTDLYGNLYLIAEVVAILASLYILIIYMVLPSYHYYQG